MFRKCLATFSVFALLSATAPGAAHVSDGAKEAKGVDAVFADLAKPGSPGCALAVARDASQQITGFVLGVGRSSGISFSKK